MENKRTVWVIFVMLLAGLILIEALKHILFPGMSTWASSAATVALVTAVFSWAASLALKRFSELNTALESETSRREKAERKLAETRETNSEILLDLHKTQARVKLLSGLLPICITCDKIRDDKGKWETLGRYIERHPEAAFSRTICDQCLQIIYSEEEESESDRNL